MRTSIFIETSDTKILIDCGPDLRQQMLRAGVKSLDAVVLTHEHNDHIIGLDDIRPFNFMQKKEMSVYASDQVAHELMRRFSYIFADNRYPGAPMVQLKKIDKSTPFEINSVPILPIEAQHGTIPVLGFRINNFTYLTDVKTITSTELEKVKGTEYLILNALHQKPHFSHLNLQEALDLINILQPKQAYLTHISHRMGLHEEVSKLLPQNVSLAYDELQLEIQ